MQWRHRAASALPVPVRIRDQILLIKERMYPVANPDREGGPAQRHLAVRMLRVDSVAAMHSIEGRTDARTGDLHVDFLDQLPQVLDLFERDYPVRAHGVGDQLQRARNPIEV